MAQEQNKMSGWWYIAIFFLPILGLVGFFMNYRRDSKGAVMLLVASIILWVVYTIVLLQLGVGSA